MIDFWINPPRLEPEHQDKVNSIEASLNRRDCRIGNALYLVSAAQGGIIQRAMFTGKRPSVIEACFKTWDLFTGVGESLPARNVFSRPEMCGTATSQPLTAIK